MLVRPFRTPEVLWAAVGAGLIVGLDLLPVAAAMHAVLKGTDVYLFLGGMMLLSEVARREGLFDWLAVAAIRAARGSARRLFLGVYLAGTVVTIFLSNDATAVVMTPAVIAASRRARTDPLPLLFACAFTANAASFVLPISNPANLVLFGGHTPALVDWLVRFGPASLASIAVTFFALRRVSRQALGTRCASDLPALPLSAGGRTCLGAIGTTAMVLMAVSAADLPLGWPTAALGIGTAAVVLIRSRASPWPVLRGISWSVLPLVAALFVLVEALDSIGIVRPIATWLAGDAGPGVFARAAAAGAVIAFGSNLVNNLPAGLLASSAVALGHPDRAVQDALLIGVDLGPNLSVTGSLATILWLGAIRREGGSVGFWRFLRAGAVVMPPALALALLLRLVLGPA